MKTQTFSTFRKTEHGGMTVFGMFIIVACLITGGLAVDVMNGVKIRTQLQTAADTAAHASLMARTYGKTEDEAKQIGILLANTVLAKSGISDTLRTEDVTFGKWDSANQVFDSSSSSDSAVLVSAQRLAARNTALPTSFLSFIGVNKFDVVSQSVFETYVPTCTREGFFAYDRVDMQGGNDFTNGFCIHSQRHVEIQTGNSFSSNVIVSMPDQDDLVLPSSGMDNNTGLDQSLRSGTYAIPILDRLDSIIDNMDNPDSDWFTDDYVSLDPFTGDPPVVVIGKNDKLSEVWTEGAVHERTCTAKNGANGTVTFDGSGTYKNGVLVTNCLVVLSSNVHLYDVAIGTTNTDPDASVSASANIILGLVDGCSDVGSVQIATMGGIDFAAGMSAYGLQMIALHNVEFSSGADAVEGISIVAGGEIDTQSQGVMAFCDGAGMPSNWIAEYFRMAT